MVRVGALVVAVVGAVPGVVGPGAPPSELPELAGFEEAYDRTSMRALFRSNRARIARLGNDAALTRRVCDAATVPFPRHQGRRLTYLHVPKAGTAFFTAVSQYGCVNGTLPSNGDPKPGCHVEETTRYGRACDWRAVEVADIFAERCSPPYALYLPSGSPDDFKATLVHKPVSERMLAGGADYAGMFRMPDQRLASAFNFGRHAWAIPKHYLPHVPRDLVHFAFYPGIRGCQAKMLIGKGCSAVWRPGGHRSAAAKRLHTAKSNCYAVSRNWSVACQQAPERIAANRLAAWCTMGIDCGGPDLTQVRDALATLTRLTFAGITELWELSICLFHRLVGGDVRPGEFKVSNQQAARAAAPNKYDLKFFDLADE